MNLTRADQRAILTGPMADRRRFVSSCLRDNDDARLGRTPEAIVSESLVTAGLTIGWTNGALNGPDTRKAA